MVVNVTDSFTQRLARVRERIYAACARAHRDSESVRLLAVTKIFGPETIREAYASGLRNFGENYVQEMERKAPAVADLADAQFHLIGHLQSNKTKKAALDVMIEIRLSQEANKSGADPADLPAIADAIRATKHLRLTGLMTVPPWSEDAELSRPYFAELRRLAANNAIPELSMGMSNDLEVAIEEGATWVRVGTALFGKRQRV
jgi:PLP dependent protein